MDEMDYQNLKSPMKRLGSTRKLLVFNNIRLQLTEQLKCLDTRMENQVSIVLELQDFFRRRGELELEYSKNLEKLVKNLQLRHKEQRVRREQWPLFTSFSCWEQLLTETKSLSRDHLLLYDVYSNRIVTRLGQVVEDVQRIYKKCREISSDIHEDILRVLQEFYVTMKTYHSYQTELLHAENKLKTADTQRAKFEQSISPEKLEKSKKYKILLKEVAKRTKKFNSAKLTFMKAKNEYILCMEASNTCIHKYFVEDLSDLIDCMDFGFYQCITRALAMHITGKEGHMKSMQLSLDAVNMCVKALDSRLDKKRFIESHHVLFQMPKKFEFQENVQQLCEQQPMEPDQQKSLHTEMDVRFDQLERRITTLRAETEEVWKTVATAEVSLLNMINMYDDDCSGYFVNPGNSSGNLSIVTSAVASNAATVSAVAPSVTIGTISASSTATSSASSSSSVAIAINVPSSSTCGAIPVASNNSAAAVSPTVATTNSSTSDIAPLIGVIPINSSDAATVNIPNNNGINIGAGASVSFSANALNRSTTQQDSVQANLKLRADFQETEDFYLVKFREYIFGAGKVARLEAKQDCLKMSLMAAEATSASNKNATSTSSNCNTLKTLVKTPRRKRIGGAIQGNGNPKLFGGSLEEYLEVTNQEIPLVMRSCIRVINLYGLHHQGIFRVSGSQVEINAFREAFERGEDPLAETTDSSDINSVCGVLKLYLRELREPLIPIIYFEQFVALSQLESRSEFIRHVKELISVLPRVVIVVMRYIFAFLNHLSEFSDENMMDSYNLSICFGPTLVPVPDDRDQVQCQNQVNEVIKNIIIFYDDIFPNDGGIVYEKYIAMDSDDHDVGDSPLEHSHIDLDSDVCQSEDDSDSIEAMAQYDFNARSEREVSFKKGDIIYIHSQISNDWWRGIVNGKAGLIPDKYISLKMKDDERDKYELLNGSSSEESVRRLRSSYNSNDASLIVVSEAAPSYRVTPPPLHSNCMSDHSATTCSLSTWPTESFNDTIYSEDVGGASATTEGYNSIPCAKRSSYERLDRSASHDGELPSSCGNVGDGPRGTIPPAVTTESVSAIYETMPKEVLETTV